MFTSAEYQLLRKRAPEDLKAFFDVLNIPAAEADWADSQKVRRLDAEAEKKVEELLQSKSLIAGCYVLLERAKIPFAFSDTTGALLSSIAENQAEVRNAMTMLPPLEKSQPQMQSRTAGRTSEPIRSATPKASAKSGGSRLYRWIGAGFIALGAVWMFIVKGHPVIGAAVTSAGAFMMARGVAGKGAAQTPSSNRPQTGSRERSHPSREQANVVSPEAVPTTDDEKAKQSVVFTEVEADRAMRALVHLQRLYQTL